MIELTRKHVRKAIPQHKRELGELQACLVLTKELEGFKTDMRAQKTAGMIRAKIQAIERQHSKRVRLMSKAHYRLEGECIGKYWSGINKEKKLRDIIYSLRDENHLQKQEL